MTQQLPVPTNITSLLRHLAHDHPYQNRDALAAGESPETIMLGYVKMFMELAVYYCQEFCTSDSHVCRALAESTVRAIHDSTHGITYNTGFPVAFIQSDDRINQVDLAFIQSNDRMNQVIELVNAHHTHLSAIPDTVDSLINPPTA